MEKDRRCFSSQPDKLSPQIETFLQEVLNNNSPDPITRSQITETITWRELSLGAKVYIAAGPVLTLLSVTGLIYFGSKRDFSLLRYSIIAACKKKQKS